MNRELEFDQSASTSKGDSEVFTDSPRTYLGQSLKGTYRILDGSFKHEMCKNSPGLSKPYIHKRCLNNPPQVRKIHMEFLKAGADIIRTNTTTAFFSIMKKTQKEYTEGDYEKLIRKAVEIATGAVDEHNNYLRKERKHQQQAMVVGSCGHLDKSEEMSDEDRKKEYRHLIKLLSGAGINTFCFEDIQNGNDAKMLSDLLEELKPKIALAYMMFKLNSKGKLTDDIEWTKVACLCASYPVTIAVGINCVHPDIVKDLLKQFHERQKREMRKISLIVCIDKVQYNLKWHPFGFIPLPIDWAALGVRYIGGCCNVHPEHISEIHEELKKYNGPSY